MDSKLAPSMLSGYATYLLNSPSLVLSRSGYNFLYLFFFLRRNSLSSELSREKEKNNKKMLVLYKVSYGNYFNIKYASFIIMDFLRHKVIL